jgi:hypothetical protein
MLETTSLAAIIWSWVLQALLAGGTIALAIYTARLYHSNTQVIAKTAQLAEEATAARVQADQQHRDLLRPIVYVDASLQWDHAPPDSGYEFTATLAGNLINVGPGPAVSVNVWIAPMGITPKHFFVGMIGPNASQPLVSVSWGVRTTEHSHGVKPFRLVTKYMDLFKTTRHVQQYSYSGYGKDLIVEKFDANIFTGEQNKEELNSFQIGFMSIGVGFLVGFGIRILGHGMDRIFGYMGAVLALAGCVLGNILAAVIAASVRDHIPFADILARLTPDVAWRILTEGFNLIDLLFYGIAIYFGYHYSFQKITPEELQALQAAEPEPPPATAAPL